MKYLNLGCGSHYSSKKEWTNLDFVSNDKNVIAHNLLKGIPFEDNTFDLVYHSHVLEHFSKDDGENFIKECFRVLKPNGILRVVIPDLENIVKNYLSLLNEGFSDLDNPIIKANYEWMLLEMYDQTVRNVSGGMMEKVLSKKELINEEFVLKRIGVEGEELRKTYKTQKTEQSDEGIRIRTILRNVRKKLKKQFFSILGMDPHVYRLGQFRLEGQIHQWMYDKYSLTSLLKAVGGSNIKVRDAFTSYIQNWSEYYLDGKDNIVRKPDSLFIESMKE